MKLSVIISFCDDESYIAGCLDSLLSQCTSDTEIYCYNSNSHDDTVNIIGEYMKIYSQISLLDDYNMNLIGGDYVLFLDARDLVNMVDLSISHEISESCPDIITNSSRLHTGEYLMECYDFLLNYNEIFYSRNFLLKNNISFYTKNPDDTLLEVLTSVSFFYNINRNLLQNNTSTCRFETVFNKIKKTVNSLKDNTFLLNVYMDYVLKNISLDNFNPTFNELIHSGKIMCELLEYNKLKINGSFKKFRKEFDKLILRTCSEINDEIISVIVTPKKGDNKIFNCLINQTFNNFRVYYKNFNKKSIKAICEEYDTLEFTDIINEYQPVLSLEDVKGKYVFLVEEDMQLGEKSLEKLLLLSVYYNPDTILTDEKLSVNSIHRYSLRANSYDNMDVQTLLAYMQRPDINYYKKSYLEKYDFKIANRKLQTLENNYDKKENTKLITLSGKTLSINYSKHNFLDELIIKGEINHYLGYLEKLREYYNNKNVWEKVEDKYYSYYFEVSEYFLTNALEYDKQTLFMKIKENFLKMDIPEYVQRKIKRKQTAFYMHIINSYSYEDYRQLNGKKQNINNDDELVQILLNQILEKNRLIDQLEKKNKIYQEEHEILLKISEDIENRTLVTNDELEIMENEEVFDKEYYRQRYAPDIKYHPLIHYIYTGYYKKNKVNMYNSDKITKIKYFKKKRGVE